MRDADTAERDGVARLRPKSVPAVGPLHGGGQQASIRQQLRLADWNGAFAVQRRSARLKPVYQR